jgi:hypothetical protein
MCMSDFDSPTIPLARCKFDTCPGQASNMAFSTPPNSHLWSIEQLGNSPCYSYQLGISSFDDWLRTRPPKDQYVAVFRRQRDISICSLAVNIPVL